MWRLALTVIASNLLISLVSLVSFVNFVDVFMAGQLGPTALAATSLVGRSLGAWRPDEARLPPARRRRVFWTRCGPRRWARGPPNTSQGVRYTGGETQLTVRFSHGDFELGGTLPGSAEARPAPAPSLTYD